MEAISIVRTIEDYLSGQHDEELVLSRLTNAARSQNAENPFNPEELAWLQAHFDKIPSILRSQMACRIYVTIDKQRGAYLRQLCRRLSGDSRRPLNNNSVAWWLKKFFVVQLLHRTRAARGWDAQIYYYTPKQRYPNLVRFLVGLMKKRIGQD